MRSVLRFGDLPSTEHAHEFVGAEHGDVPFSIILVHAAPGAGPRLHRHPYAEVFVVESGEATFQLGDDTMVVRGGEVVVGPANVPQRLYQHRDRAAAPDGDPRRGGLRHGVAH
jgi:quercetin dioxygenase-like cupin family protein